MPPNALESVAVQGGRTVYLDRAALAQLGSVPGRVFASTPATTDWSRVVDGVVVFRQERPPERVRPLSPL